MKTTGTEVDRILNLISRFFDYGGRSEKRQGDVDKLLKLFEKYLGRV
jgi:type I restriction enzyme R subunit